MNNQCHETKTPSLSRCIKVIGIGPEGCTAVARMAEIGVQGVTFICASSDSQTNTSPSPAYQHIDLLRHMRDARRAGLNHFDMQRAAAAAISAAIEGTHLLFIVTGMDHGMRSGWAWVTAKLARKAGILTVGVVMVPATYESDHGRESSEVKLADFERRVDTLFVLPQEALPHLSGEDTSVKQALPLGQSDLPATLVSQIAGILDENHTINTDFEEMHTVLRQPGKAAFNTAVASGSERAHLATEKVLAHPLFASVNWPSARCWMVVVSAAVKSLKLTEYREVTRIIRAQAPLDATIICSTLDDEALDDGLRVSVAVTGMSGH